VITTAGALTVPLVHLHRWLDRMNVPPAPEDAGDGLWYRLGYLERAAQAPEGDEERILTDVVRHLSEACGGVELADADPISQFSALLSRVQQLSQGASPAAYEIGRAHV
jgi:hypothetical protein